LLGSILRLGAANLFAIRRWIRENDRSGIDLLTPAFAEVEAGAGMIIILAAAALTSQPPAVDVQAGRASFLEVLNTFAPQMPRLTPPANRFPGFLWTVCMIAVGFVLLFYRESLPGQ